MEMRLAKKELLVIGIVMMLLVMNGCSSSSSYRSSSSSDYDRYDGKYSSEEIGDFVNEYKDSFGW